MARRRRYVRRSGPGAEKQPSSTAPARWVEERTAVLRALEGYPEARQAVLREDGAGDGVSADPGRVSGGAAAHAGEPVVPQEYLCEFNETEDRAFTDEITPLDI